MKKSIFFSSLFVIFFAVFACKKEVPKMETSSISKVENNVTNPIKGDTWVLDDSEFGISSTTEYNRKGSNNRELLYTQTPAKTDFGWVNYMNIDGKKEVFLFEMKIPNPMKTKLDIC